jgi:inner membrane protein
MPDVGHVAVGLAAARLYTGAAVSENRGMKAALAFSAVSLLPDCDMLGRAAGLPDSALLGHRGALHSFAFAVLVGLAARIFARSGRAALFSFAVAASHGALDMLDTGALGVAYFWPLTDRRFFWPLRFLPGPPPGEHWLTAAGARSVVSGAVFFVPLFAYALRRRAERC